MGQVSGVVDADGHVVESAEQLLAFGWSGSTGNEALDHLFASPELGYRPDLEKGALDPTERLGDMDREGIEVAVNYPTFALLVNQLDVGPATDLAGAYNRWFSATYHATDPDRLRAMALVSLADPEGAAREAKRAVTEQGATGILVSPFCGPLHLGDQRLDPLWRTAQELGVAVAVHGGRSTTAPHLSASNFPEDDQRTYYAMAHPFGQMMAMGDLVFGGVLERFSDLRFAFLEAGIGWIPWYVDRLDEAWESIPPPPGASPLPRRPSDYLLGGTCYFSCEPDEGQLSTMVDAVGEDQVLFASDYPHFDCKCPRSLATLAGNGLSPRVLDKVARANPSALYRL